MKYMYLFLLVLTTSPVLASVYATEEAAINGVSRGATETFTRGIGFLDVKSKTASGEAGSAGNAVLISKNKILTVAHAFKKRELASVSVVFYPDIIEFNTHMRENPGVPFHGKPARDMAANLDLSSIVIHPFLDLAIATLKHDLPGVALTPLLLRDLKESTMSGFLTSHSKSYVLRRDVPYAHEKRHISILKGVKELPVPEGEGESTYWVKAWDIPEGVDASNPTNKIFRPLKDEHRLAAYSLPSDSGAPFVVKMGGDFVIAGLYKGKNILLRAPEDTTAGKSAAAGAGAGAGAASASSADAVKHYIAEGLITPLYLAADWIKSNI